MKITDKINMETIIFPLQAISKQDVIEEMLNHCIALDYLTAYTKLKNDLNHREKIFNAASGRAVAYHYNVSIEVNEIIAVLGISNQGIDYQASDGLLCNFILLILEPKNKLNQHRKLINLFQGLINNYKIKSKLLEAQDTEQIFQIFLDWENSNLNII